jgi:hypothetical protein
MRDLRLVTQGRDCQSHHLPKGQRTGNKTPNFVVGESIEIVSPEREFLSHLRKTALVSHGNFRNTATKIAGGCQFLLVDARRIRSRRCAGTEAE